MCCASFVPNVDAKLLNAKLAHGVLGLGLYDKRVSVTWNHTRRGWEQEGGERGRRRRRGGESSQKKLSKFASYGLPNSFQLLLNWNDHGNAQASLVCVCVCVDVDSVYECIRLVCLGTGAAYKGEEGGERRRRRGRGGG